ncbi:MAG TPA: 6,7-dimethyl-8-ribityllumazine synthase [Candidatus Paceibacterota bacterium]|jgi:6,7-dimethyl-8-ribityllumazine synthase|nr:6,7-dimethyl-8-ribityllumazine synthase [Candidatus Paceibacterota bacterium]
MQRKEFLKKEDAQDASKLVVGIAVADFNPDITGGLLEGAMAALKEWGVKEKNISIRRVYGSFDLTYACDLLLRRKKMDAVVALGCIIKGETDHDKHIASAVFNGLTALTIAHGKPVSLGILTTNDLAQAKARSRGKTNHGEKAAVAALRAALLQK